MTLKRTVRQTIEHRLGPEAAETAARGLQWTKGAAFRALSPTLRSTNAHLGGLQGAYAGETCVIVGNGPSLNSTDLSLLEGRHVIALNRGYIKFDEIGLVPTFLVCVNRHVAEQFGAELANVSCPKVVSRACYDYLPRTQLRHPFYVLESLPGPRFSPDIRRGVWEGCTVTYVAMQLAYFLGFRKVILIGVDHRFTTKGPAHKLVVSDAGDPNHFDPSYFGPGVAWQLPDLETSEIAYRLALREFHKAGRTIVDCTVNGNLTVFPRSSLAAEIADHE